MARAVNGVKSRNLLPGKVLVLEKEKAQGPVPKDGRVLENHGISVKENSSIKLRKKILVSVTDKLSIKEIKVPKSPKT